MRNVLFSCTFLILGFQASFAPGLADSADATAQGDAKKCKKTSDEHRPLQKLLLDVSSSDRRDQIIYFVTIDRFADGDPRNNDQGAGEYSAIDESRVVNHVGNYFGFEEVDEQPVDGATSPLSLMTPISP